MFSKEKNGDYLPHKNLKHSGFPSPANDYIENPINLNELLVKRPSATFLMRFRGHEMICSGIKNTEDTCSIVHCALLNYQLHYVVYQCQALYLNH